MPEVEEVQVPSVATQDDVAPKEPVAERAETSEDSETSDSDVENGEKPQKPVKGGFQRKIDRLTRELQLERERAEEWRNQALRTDKPAKAEAPKEVKKPKAEEFKTVEEYLDARDDWAIGEAQRKAEEVYETKSKAQQAKTQEERIAQTWDEKIEAARAKYDDFDEVTPELRVSDSMKLPLLRSELGAEVGYFLAKNPEEAARIGKLDTLDAAREIGRIEAYIAELEAEGEKQADESDEKPEKPVTKAPPPPTPVKKSAPSGRDIVYDDKSDVDEWRKAREAQTRGK